MNFQKSIKAFSLFTAFLACGTALHAQNDPTFTTSNQIRSFQIYYDSNNANEQYSPALIASPTTGVLWVAYVDASTNRLSVARSSDGLNFSVTQQTGQFMNSAPNWGVFNNRLYLTFAPNTSTISIYSLNEQAGTVTDQQDLNVVLGGGVVARRPGLASITDAGGVPHLYLSWNGYDYDPGSGQSTGPYVNVIQTTDPAGIFPAVSTYATPVSRSYLAGSAPALTAFNGSMYLTYLEASTGYPQMFAAPAGSTTFADRTGAGGGHGNFGGDPAPVVFQGALYPMFRAADVGGNLWTLGTYDGVNLTPSYRYGQTMKYSPSTTVSLSGVLYQAAFTDHPSSGTFMWIQSGSSATTNPYPQYTGGTGVGGDGGDPGNGGGDCQGNCLTLQPDQN